MLILLKLTFLNSLNSFIARQNNYFILRIISNQQNVVLCILVYQIYYSPIKKHFGNLWIVNDNKILPKYNIYCTLYHVVLMLTQPVLIAVLLDLVMYCYHLTHNNKSSSN